MLQNQKHRKNLFHWSRGVQLTLQIMIIKGKIFFQGSLDQPHKRCWKRQILFIIMWNCATEMKSRIIFSHSKWHPVWFVGFFRGFFVHVGFFWFGGFFLTSYPILRVIWFPSKEHYKCSLAATSHQLSLINTILHIKMHYKMLMTVSVVSTLYTWKYSSLSIFHYAVCGTCMASQKTDVIAACCWPLDATRTNQPKYSSPVLPYQDLFPVISRHFHLYTWSFVSFSSGAK